MKTNVPIDSKTSGQTFMRFRIKILSVWVGVMGYVSFDLGALKGAKPPNDVYTYLTDLYEIWNIDCRHKRECNELCLIYF